MTGFTPLLEHNRAFATSTAREGLLPIPRRRLLILTCLDSRVDPAHVLGVELGDALVLRNSGGRVTREVVDEIALVAQMSETVLGAPTPFEVAVLHHTACGTRMLADEGFRRAFAARVGGDADALAEAAVTDPVATVQADVERLRTSALLPPVVSVSGHVYDVESGLVRTVASVEAAP